MSEEERMMDHREVEPGVYVRVARRPPGCPDGIVGLVLSVEGGVARVREATTVVCRGSEGRFDVEALDVVATEPWMRWASADVYELEEMVLAELDVRFPGRRA